jgi:tetratricopeptide (TPR) repeat protein
MPLNINLQELFRLADTWQDTYSEDEQLQAFAKFACQRCCDWFGVPDDEQWPYRILQGPYIACQRQLLLRSYILSLTPDLKDDFYRFEATGHEMFHRVTYRRKGAIKVMWIREMMAERTAYHLLQEGGFSQYGGALAYHYWHTPHMFLPDFYRARARYIKFGLGGRAYPTNFMATAFCLGAGLEALVGWKRLRRIVSSSSLTEWLHSLSEENRILVRHLLEWDDPSKNEVEVKAHDRLAHAFYYMGEFEEALKECRQALADEPDDPLLHEYYDAISKQMKPSE